MTSDNRPSPSYERLDPDSLRRLIDAVEAKARRMRAEAMRDLLRLVGRSMYRTFAGGARAARGIAHGVVERSAGSAAAQLSANVAEGRSGTQ